MHAVVSPYTSCLLLPQGDIVIGRVSLFVHSFVNGLAETALSEQVLVVLVFSENSLLPKCKIIIIAVISRSGSSSKISNSRR